VVERGRAVEAAKARAAGAQSEAMVLDYPAGRSANQAARPTADLVVRVMAVHLDQAAVEAEALV
jgi:hypothetical protein